MDNESDLAILAEQRRVDRVPVTLFKAAALLGGHRVAGPRGEHLAQRSLEVLDSRGLRKHIKDAAAHNLRRVG